MDHDEKLARLAELRTDSRAKLEALQREGVGDVGLGFARLELFIETLWPWEEGNNETRLDFELVWEEQANVALGTVGEQVARMKLLQGVQVGPPPKPSVNGRS